MDRRYCYVYIVATRNHAPPLPRGKKERKKEREKERKKELNRANCLRRQWFSRRSRQTCFAALINPPGSSSIRSDFHPAKPAATKYCCLAGATAATTLMHSIKTVVATSRMFGAGRQAKKKLPRMRGALLVAVDEMPERRPLSVLPLGGKSGAAKTTHLVLREQPRKRVAAALVALDRPLSLLEELADSLLRGFKQPACCSPQYNTTAGSTAAAAKQNLTHIVAPPMRGGHACCG